MTTPAKHLALALGLTLAWACQATAADRTEDLQKMVQRVGQHMNLRKVSRLSSEAEFLQQRIALQNALQAWNDSQRTDADSEVMREWLAGAIQASMLGARKPMPPTPQFAEWTPRPEPVSVGVASPHNQPTPSSTPVAQKKASKATMKSTTPRITANGPTRADRRQIASKPKLAPPRNWATHPAASEIDWGDPFADEPAPSDSPRVASAPQRRLKPVVPTRSISVNMSELDSRVNGYNAGIQQLEGVLIASRDVTAFRLAAVVRELSELQSQRDLVSMYLSGLSTSEAPLRPVLDSPKSLLRMTAAAIKQRSKNVAQSDDKQATAEKAILKSLVRKLNQIQGSYQASL